MTRFYLVALVFLTGCSAGPPALQPLNSLAHPPWEAFVRAGPSAENDIDYETLDGQKIATAQPQDVRVDRDIEVATIGNAPAETRQPIAKTGAEVIQAVAVVPVEGGSKSVNKELTLAMRAAFDDAGWPVVESKSKNAITINGKLTIEKPQGVTQIVSLVWIVTSPSGKVLGDIKQQNSVPAGSLDGGWGDNATAATQAAAVGLSKLIERYR